MSNDYDELFAKYYDLINAQKNYVQELEAILSAINRYYMGAGKTLADVGCGTGNFTILFKEKGFDVRGYDVSSAMVEAAKNKYPSISFSNKPFSAIDHKFDIVTSLFNVVNSLGDYNCLSAFFDSIAKNMKSDSIFIFDAWNGCEVFRNEPKIKTKVIEKGEMKIVRTVVPTTNFLEQWSHHDYRIEIYQNNILKENVSTTLHNHFYTYQEIKHCLCDSGFEIITAFPNKEFDREIKNDFIINFVCKLK